MRVILAVLSSAMLMCNQWTDADTKSATDAVRAQVLVESECSSDNGGCIPSRVRALERMSYCSNASILYRHGQAVPDGGIACQAP